MDQAQCARLAEEASNRSNIYGFLSIVYGEKPSGEFLSRIRSEDVENVLAELGVVFDEIFDTLEEEKLIEALEVEYTRLYVGPGFHIAPFESIHVAVVDEDGKKMPSLMCGPPAKAVARELDRHGFRLTKRFKNMPDHIASELALMRFLACEEHEAWENEDKETALELLAAQRRFLTEHLGRWAPTFCDKAKDYANLRFYETLATLTKNFVVSEGETLPRLMKQADAVRTGSEHRRTK